MHLLPDPDKVRIRVYQTHSTHKSMSALRQGSMILVCDEDFHQVEGPFEEAFFTHTSTSPNLQIIASLDVARRQMELEGYELVMSATELALSIRREVNSHPLISKYFRVAHAGGDGPGRVPRVGHQRLRSAPLQLEGRDRRLGQRRVRPRPDPAHARSAARPATTAPQFKGLLAERYDIQINKTSRNSILRPDQHQQHPQRRGAADQGAGRHRPGRSRQRLAQGGEPEQEAFAARVKSLMTDVPDLPNFSRFHDAFREDPKSASNEGHMRPAFFMAYDDAELRIPASSRARRSTTG